MNYLRSFLLVVAIVLMAALVPSANATTSEDVARAHLTDCTLSDTATKLGVLSSIPDTAQRCYTYLVSIGKVLPR